MSIKKRHRKLSLGNVLKTSRVLVSLAFLLAMVALFTFTSAAVATLLGWIAKIQIMPLALLGAGVALAAWVAITMLFGRLYCSSVCPLGVLQDIFNRLAHLTRGQRSMHPFRYEKARSKTRYTILAVVAVCAVAGIAVVPSILDPYSTFGRISSELLLPLWNFLTGSPVYTASFLAMGIAIVSVIAVAWLSFRNGRLICNTICPVGSALGLFSRFSLLHMDIDTDVCVNCRKCERACKAQCINMADHVVDGSRCVMCFNCIDACDSNAIRYTTRRKHLSIPMMQPVRRTTTATSAIADTTHVSNVEHAKDTCTNNAEQEPVKIDRRKFMATGLLIAATPAVDALAKGTRRIKALEYGGKPLTPKRYVAPPGRQSMARFLELCTGCGLCVAQCPSRVLHPSVNEFGWLNVMHPMLRFDDAYCRYNCTRCTEVCPTGALRPLTQEEKHIFIIGHARVEANNCIACGLCSERCPRKTISMKARKPWKKGEPVWVAAVDTSLCIGCGACEYICPASPEKAIAVDGIV